jgi:hypothetical protein
MEIGRCVLFHCSTLRLAVRRNRCNEIAVETETAGVIIVLRI